MALYGYVGHHTPDGQDILAMAQGVGYTAFTRIGENVAGGNTSVSRLHE